MKRTLTGIGAISLMVWAAHAGPETIIRERAKELSNQNNVRQGVASPAQTTQPAQPVPVKNSSAQAPSLARLHTDLAAVKVNAPVPLSQNQLITQDLMAGARGTKLSSSTAFKLASSMSSALAIKPLSAADRGRLIQNLGPVLNPGTTSSAQMQAILADIQAIFQANGLPRNSAVAIANDAKAIVAETQKPAPK